MPDLMSHVAAAYLISRPWPPRTRRISPLTALFCLGTILPDLLTRAPVVLLPYLIPQWLILPWHTPIGVGLVCLVLAFAFPEKDRPAYLAAMASGALLHLGLDFFQIHLDPHDSYYWLFPFSNLSKQLGLFWPDQTVFASSVLVFAALVLEVVIRRGRSK